DPQRCMLAFLAGDFEQAVRLMPQAQLSIDRFDEPEELLLLLTRTVLAVIHYERGAGAAASETLDSLKTDAEHTLPEILAPLIRTRVLCLEHSGSLEQADLLLERAAVQARQQNAKRLSLYLAALRLEMATRRGSTIAVT